MSFPTLPALLILAALYAPSAALGAGAPINATKIQDKLLTNWAAAVKKDLAKGDGQPATLSMMTRAAPSVLSMDAREDADSEDGGGIGALLAGLINGGDAPVDEPEEDDESEPAPAPVAPAQRAQSNPGQEWIEANRREQTEFATAALSEARKVETKRGLTRTFMASGVDGGPSLTKWLAFYTLPPKAVAGAERRLSTQRRGGASDDDASEQDDARGGRLSEDDASECDASESC